MGLFSNIGAGLKMISFSAKIDDEYFEELEEQLIMADVGVATSTLIVEKLRERARKERLSEASHRSWSTCPDCAKSPQPPVRIPWLRLRRPHP